LGTNGQLGSAFLSALHGKGYPVDFTVSNLNCYFVDTSNLNGAFIPRRVDVTSYNVIENIFKDLKPDLIVNCAAVTNVDLTEVDPSDAYMSNVIGSLNLNLICKSHNIGQIFFSTEAAYDGTRKSKYLETDLENPQSKYALTKVIADHIILNSDAQAWIFRTSWLYSLNSNSSFVTRILKKSKSSHSNIGVTDDIVGNPTPAWWLAETILNLLDSIASLPTGLYHLCSSNAVSKYDWAKRIITDLNPEKVSLIVPTKRNDFPNAHLRSPYVDLSTDKIQCFLGESPIPTWEELWNESIK